MKLFLIISAAALLILGGAGFALHKILQQPVSIATPTPKPEVTITIPEGFRREQIAVLVDTKGVCEYTAFLAASTGLEGKLFPDTYRFFPNSTCESVVATLTANYTKRTSTLNVTGDQLILASIVEREAVNDSEREAIAGVYANRIRISMKLDADPTVQYGKDTNAWKKASQSKTFTFWDPILRADYDAVISPYNTYKSAGLPPTPISNPGLKSIQAAISPATHSYFYFFHRDGVSYFSKTFAEHQAKLAQ